MYSLIEKNFKESPKISLKRGTFYDFQYIYRISLFFLPILLNMKWVNIGNCVRSGWTIRILIKQCFYLLVMILTIIKMNCTANLLRIFLKPWKTIQRNSGNILTAIEKQTPYHVKWNLEVKQQQPIQTSLS